MDKYINASIYIIYLIIGTVSIVISLQVSIVMALIVVVIEGVRLIALYKKVYLAVVIVFIGNMCLVGYNSYKSQAFIEYNNSQIQQNNTYTQNYLKTKDLRANTAEKWKNSVEKLEKISIDWWFLIGAYLFLELTLLLVIRGIHKQEKQVTKPKTVKKVVVEKQEVKPATVISDTDNENLKEVGGYAEYYKANNISRSEAKKLFAEWKEKGLLVKKDGKNYLKV